MQLQFQHRDGRPVVVKRTDHPARFEAQGLAALAAAGARTPEVMEVGAHHMVMQDLSQVGPGDDAAWKELGACLAGVHAVVGPSHGWTGDNIIGTTVQHNEPDDDWPRFFWNQRIAPHLPVVPDAVAVRLRRGRAPLMRRLAHDAVPSLVHGDLWRGNVLGGRWLIDPAVAWSDRELDLAFSTLFGVFPRAFHAAYEETWPLDDGWQERQPILQLYHLLVHVRMFGASYVPAVIARLEAQGL